jgi:prepilin-type N-terminal cleavage/methylation domain-containing protein
MRPRGFSLVETVLVMALAGLLVHGGVVSLKSLVPKFRLLAGAWEVRSVLNEARFSAIWTGAPRRVTFAASGYVLESYDEAVSAWRALRSARVEGVKVEANNNPAFYPEGTVANLATLTVANSRGAYRITIAITGRIRVLKVG